MTKKIPRERETKTKMIVIKLSQSEYIKIKAMADTYADKNVSAWIRYTAIHHKP